MLQRLACSGIALLLLTSPFPAGAPQNTARTVLEQQREALVERMREELDLWPEQVTRLRRIFAGSAVLGQGNPEITRYALSREDCASTLREQPPFLPDWLCKSPNMVALYDPSRGETPDDARICIDQFEFPGIPCEYPIVHATAWEAVQLCEAVGKRICDAHEWEGACAGSVEAPEEEYAWGHDRATMRARHNRSRERVWAYGLEKDHSLCGTGSEKSEGCQGGGFASCGSNTYPAGSFPSCVSPFGVYDLHGNVAEHMNLPIGPGDLASRGGRGVTEMKGSWFIFSTYEAHEDDCRWRAPDWHASKVDDPRSHSNYHLGFRCCKDVAAQSPP